MNAELIIFDTGYALTALLSLILGIFVLFRNYKKSTNYYFFLTTVAFTIYSVGYLLGLNAPTQELSHFYLLFTIANIFTVIFNAQMAFAMFNVEKQQRVGVGIIYAIGLALTAFYIADPNRYVLTSKPFTYFPTFYNIGPYYWLFLAFFFAVSGYFFTIVGREYLRSDRVTKKKAQYFIAAFGWAYTFGSIGFIGVFHTVLHFDLDIFPSMLMGLYTIPLAYGIIQYKLIDLRIFARNAFLYSVFTISVGLAIVGINILNNYLTTTYSTFPFWFIPFCSGIFAVGLGLLVWNQIRQVDALKYEFINNISHKFRTPLTHIRWMAEEFRDEGLNDVERNKYVDQIQYASMRLFELTNIVMDVAKNDVDDNFYRLTPVNIPELIEIIRSTHEDQIKRKNLKLTITVEPKIPEVAADKTRMQVALQIILENSLIYTPDNGTISIHIYRQENDLIVSCKDSGIGIDKTEIPFIFAKFYRTQTARHTDTEGMGIGLYMAKNIIEKHHGTIWAESEGLEKGATFMVSLPITNEFAAKLKR